MSHRAALLSSIVCAGALLGSVGTAETAPSLVLQKRSPPVGDAKSKAKPPDVRKAIEGGLVWLARHQAPDGSWSTRLAKRCGPESCFAPDDPHEHFDTGLTALALLAFLRAGHLPDGKNELVEPRTKAPVKTGEVVLRGLEWLRKKQASSGEFYKNPRVFVYDEALAVLAMAEALALTKDEKWKDSAQRGANALVSAQRPNPGGSGWWGWHYSPRWDVPEAEMGNADTSATGWCVVALSAAHAAGLKVEKFAFEGALNYVDSVSQKDGLAGYSKREDAGKKVTGPHDEFDYHVATMSALAIQIRLGSGTTAVHEFFDAAAQQVQKDPPAVSASKRSVDYYYWYHGASALNRLDELQPKKGKAKKKYAESWNKALIEAACSLQDTNSERCSLGGWLINDRWSYEGGSVYSTAMAVLALEAAQGK